MNIVNNLFNEILDDRYWFVEAAKSYLGTPYKRGGQNAQGVDCSGLVVECLESIGIMKPRTDMTADQLWKFFNDKPVANPGFGNIAFWFDGDSLAVHVGICLNDHLVISATGIDPQNRAVKINTINYRPEVCRILDVLG